jgi:hypothetical protein
MTPDTPHEFGCVAVSRKVATDNSQGRKPLETISESRKPQRGDRSLPTAA